MKSQFLSTLAVICLLAATGFAQTNTYSVPGLHSVVVPAGAKLMSVKLWGAGGGNGIFAPGGGGAYVRAIVSVIPSEGYVVMVGQRGAQGSANLGGNGSGNAEGGAPGFLGDYNERGQGGQASSIFNVTNARFVMKAVAGAGGGAGRNAGGGGGGQHGAGFAGAAGGWAGTNGIGGPGGGNGNAGSDYASNAITTGISSLNLAGGHGGNGANWSGGGGGGYGGGGGAGGGEAGDGAGGGGGGSFGEVISPGNGSQPGNTSDADYIAGAGSAANDGLVFVAFTTDAFAPSIAARPATSQQLDGATLHASINPAGAATSYYFEYGTNTDYGNLTATQTLPSGTTAVAVSQPITDLLTDTTYHFRVVASNSVGVINGPDVTFTTVRATNAFRATGIYTNTVPERVSKMTVKLWGAGGGSSALGGNGGGGAFSSVSLDVSPGQDYVVVVGQRGAAGNVSLGGVGSGNTEGGAPGYLGDYNHRAQGGQASSLFSLSGGLLTMKAVAGAGGGAGIGRNGGAGGQSGANGSSAVAGQPGSTGTGGTGGGAGGPGSDYNADALTIGISSFSVANGKGGDAHNWSGGGGGGYGGGGGGGGGENGSGAGGGGGGSYGDTIIAGSGSQAANTSDPDYAANAGMGAAGGPAAGGNPGNDGAVVIIWSAVVPASAAILKNPTLLSNGSFQFSFTNFSGATFTALGTTNISLAASNWNVVGPATEISPGQFQFTDPQATNFAHRFYMLRSP